MVQYVIFLNSCQIPISGRNPNFRYTVSGVKPHILVINKKDLADLQMRSEMENILRKYGYHHIIFTNCKDKKCPGVKQVGICKYVL
jgi:ethanolamine utilization protein EutP (predicted NTPase)